MNENNINRDLEQRAEGDVLFHRKPQEGTIFIPSGSCPSKVLGYEQHEPKQSDEKHYSRRAERVRLIMGIDHGYRK